MDHEDVERLRTWIARITANDAPERDHCEHLHQVSMMEPVSEGCEACLALGDRWVHLRVCLSCGYVGCCDDSKNRHARQHARESNHPLVASAEPGETWVFCYEDEALFI